MGREGRDNYVPDVSALEQDIIEVDAETKEMLKMMDFQSIPGLQMTSSGHLEAGNRLEVHHLQHLLGFSINLDDVLLKSRDVGDVVVPPLPLFLLQLDGDAAHSAPLQPLHQVGD